MPLLTCTKTPVAHTTPKNVFALRSPRVGLSKFILQTGLRCAVLRHEGREGITIFAGIACPGSPLIAVQGRSCRNRIRPDQPHYGRLRGSRWTEGSPGLLSVATCGHIFSVSVVRCGFAPAVYDPRHPYCGLGPFSPSALRHRPIFFPPARTMGKFPTSACARDTRNSRFPT